MYLATSEDFPTPDYRESTLVAQYDDFEVEDVGHLHVADDNLLKL